MSNPSPKRRKSKPKSHFNAVWIPRTLGLSMFGGFGLMRYYFWPGIAVVYVWFAVLIWEICFEPELIKRPVWIQVVGIGIVGVLFDIFTIGVVAARAPIDIYSYAMRSGNYSDGTDIGGITWNSHFTALTVAITNSTADDYTDLDLTVRPDKLTYKAVIFGDSAGCNLSSIGGNTMTLPGTPLKVSDSRPSKATQPSLPRQPFS